MPDDLLPLLLEVSTQLGLEVHLSNEVAGGIGRPIVGLTDLLNGCHDKIHGNVWKTMAENELLVLCWKTHKDSDYIHQ
jgi:hypothetical protein